MDNDYGNSFSVCFNMMKIKYADYDKDIENSNFLIPSDKVNVFISYESILNNISCVKDIDKKVILEREFPVIMTSDTLNIAAHYKRFFRDNKLETRVFIYYTDLKTAYPTTKYANEKYIEEYRGYYGNKFMGNPKYVYMSESLVEDIIPKVQMIAQFIPNVHFIRGENIEGSLIPLIISNMDKSYKNFVVTSDIYDAQYQLYDNFMCHLIKRSPVGASIISNPKTTMKTILKAVDETIPDWISTNKYFCCLILGAMGNKSRSIEPIKGLGTKGVIKYILKGIEDGTITQNTNQIELLVKIFPEDIQKQMENNFRAFNLEYQHQELTEHNIYQIKSQIVDRFDNNSLIQLNSTEFYHYPLMLPELTS